jgi:hypothetical protein
MVSRALTVTGYIMRDNKRIKRDDLPAHEQKRLANAWNSLAMQEAGYVYTRPDHRKEVSK